MAKESGNDNFLKLIESNKKIIFKICNSYCHNNIEREDLAQEIIYNLWKSGDSFNEDYKFSTWMYRVALNVAISFYRKENKRQTITLNEHVLNIEDKVSSLTESEENINLLQKFINELKELDRALIILYLEEKTYNEIAEILGISETNVATRISRCKEKLKQKFSLHK
ncbi:MAG: sigma-70 family RNA polymerase sigma factor [Bacteroidota bacterium]|nr:sigma-70 family RNA polymerase sigma factor [Bacteroidota bacterium]